MVFFAEEIIDGSPFFFQAEDGIRDLTVTGVQTCALPILCGPRRRRHALPIQRVASSQRLTTSLDSPTHTTDTLPLLRQPAGGGHYDQREACHCDPPVRSGLHLRLNARRHRNQRQDLTLSRPPLGGR